MGTSGADVAVLVAFETPFSGVKRDDGGVLAFGAFLVLMEAVSEFVFDLEVVSDFVFDIVSGVLVLIFFTVYALILDIVAKGIWTGVDA